MVATRAQQNVVRVRRETPVGSLENLMDFQESSRELREDSITMYVQEMATKRWFETERLVFDAPCSALALERMLNLINCGEQIVLNKLTSVFHASVLLLIMNFVITLSK